MALPGLAFRGQRYAQIKVALGSLQNDINDVFLDTGCKMSLIFKNFLFKICPTVQILKSDQVMRVRGLGSQVHDASQFCELEYYIPTLNGPFAYFKREIHIVEILHAKILLGLVIAVPERWVIDLES